MAPFDFKANCAAKTSCTSWKALGLTCLLKPKHLEEGKGPPVTRHSNFPPEDEFFASSGYILHDHTSLERGCSTLQEPMAGMWEPIWKHLYK